MSTESKVVDIIAEQLGVDKDKIKPETDIANDLGADSLDIAELLIAFEEQFDIDIDEENAQNISTVGQVIEQIKAALNENGGASYEVPKQSAMTQIKAELNKNGGASDN